MKKFMLLLTAMVIAFAASAKDQIVYNDTPLPNASKDLIAKHFKAKVNFVKLDKNLFGSIDNYEVVLSNGTELEFDSSGELKSVDAGKNAVPASLVPTNISSYVKTNFKGQKIYELDKNKKGYEVELSNGKTLNFDLNGNIVGTK